MGIKGPGSIEPHGGYEDVYVKTPAGWRIQTRTRVRDKAWHNPLLQTPDLNKFLTSDAGDGGRVSARAGL
jgi:hypothetical protein